MNIRLRNAILAVLVAGLGSGIAASQAAVNPDVSASADPPNATTERLTNPGDRLARLTKSFMERQRKSMDAQHDVMQRYFDQQRRWLDPFGAARDDAFKNYVNARKTWHKQWVDYQNAVMTPPWIRAEQQWMENLMERQFEWSMAEQEAMLNWQNAEQQWMLQQTFSPAYLAPYGYGGYLY